MTIREKADDDAGDDASEDDDGGEVVDLPFILNVAFANAMLLGYGGI